MIHPYRVDTWRKYSPNEKLRYEFPLSESSIVFDVGGFKGDWSAEISERYNCHIFIFEPIKDFYEKLTARFASKDKIKVIHAALGAEKREERFSLEADATKSAHSGVNEGESEMCQILSFGDFISEHRIEHIDLLKANIEGGEFELLPAVLNSEIGRTISDLLIQFHQLDSDSDPKMHAIQNDLRKTHHLSFQVEYVWENWTKSEEKHRPSEKLTRDYNWFVNYARDTSNELWQCQAKLDEVTKQLSHCSEELKIKSEKLDRITNTLAWKALKKTYVAAKKARHLIGKPTGF